MLKRQLVLVAIDHATDVANNGSRTQHCQGARC